MTAPVEAAAAQLDRLEQQAVSLFRRDALSPRQIAERTGLPPEHVLGVLRRHQAGLRVLPVVPPRSASEPVVPAIEIEQVHDGVAALRLADLFVDPTYQRPPDQLRVARMVASYDAALIGVIEVSDRGPGPRPRYAVVDGQHRLLMLLAHPDNGPDAVTLCHIHTDLRVEDEAELFYNIDRQRRKLSTWDRWRARRAAGEQWVIDITAVVERQGLKLDDAPRRGYVRSTATCEVLTRLGTVGLLELALVAVTRAWGRDDKDALDAELVHGTGLVLHGYGRDLLDPGDLIDRMATLTPRTVKARARARRETDAGTLPTLVAKTLVDLVNVERRGASKLPPYVAGLRVGQTKTPPPRGLT